MSVEFGYAIVYVPSVPEAIEFYEAAFEFEDSFIHESEDYGELATGNTKLAFTSHDLAAKSVPFSYQAVDEADQSPGVEFTLTTDDVDTAWRRAVDAGATSLQKPHDAPWGQRVAYVKDCFGFPVGIATPM